MFNINTVNVTDDFMTTVEDDEEWSLLDPNDETVRENIKCEKYKSILETRLNK